MMTNVTPVKGILAAASVAKMMYLPASPSFTPEFRCPKAQGRPAWRNVSMLGCLRVTQLTECKRFQLAGLGGG
jgi:hypothetical protein